LLWLWSWPQGPPELFALQEEFAPKKDRIEDGSLTATAKSCVYAKLGAAVNYDSGIRNG